MFDREDVLQKALALPADDRAYVATALEQSLAGNSSGRSAHEPELTSSHAAADAELATELRRRSAAFLAGATSARPAAEVLADLQRRQAAEQST